jgi:hypothetical protein
MPGSPVLRRPEVLVSYVIAAYALVVGSLVWYGWRVQSQRRQISRTRDADAARESNE